MIHKDPSSFKLLWDNTLGFLRTQNYQSYSGKAFGLESENLPFGSSCGTNWQ